MNVCLRVWPIALLAGLQLAQAAESRDEESLSNQSVTGYEGAVFRRWSPVVADMDRAIELFTEILGLKLASLSYDPPESYVFEIFGIEPGTPTRHAVFDAGSAKRVLSVVEVPGLRVTRTPPLPRTSVALFNANGRFDAIVEKLRAAGYETLSPHRLGSSGIEIGFIDDDGHLYGLYEIPYRGVIEIKSVTD